MNTKENTNLICIPIGDWSDDGHGKYDDFYVRVDKKFTEEVLAENYFKNKELLGFGVEDIAREYEDSSLTRDHYNRLVEAGFAFSEEPTESDDVCGDEGDGLDLYLMPRGALELCIFFMGHGLEDFEAEIVEIKADFNLFGYWSKVNETIGYGLYY